MGLPMGSVRFQGSVGRLRRIVLDASEVGEVTVMVGDVRRTLADLDDAIARALAAEVSRDAARERALAAEQALATMGHRERATATERDFYQAKLQAVREAAEAIVGHCYLRL